MRWLLVLGAAVLFGTTGTARALGAAGVDPMGIGAARIAIGGLALGTIAISVGAARHRPLPSPARARRGDLGLIAVGALGVVAYQPAFFIGTTRCGVATGTLIALGTGPVATGVLGWALRRRRPNRRWFAATATALGGVAALNSAGADAGAALGGAADPVGLAGAVGAGAAYAVYTLATKALLDRGWRPLPAAGAVFGVAGVVDLAVLAASSPTWLGQPRAVAAALWLGLIATTLAYVLFARGLAVLPAATVATLTLAEPVTATVLGVTVLGEHLSSTGWAGVALVVAAVGVLVVPLRRARRVEAATS